MNRALQRQWAEALRARHLDGRVLLLPNAWDALSAKLFAQAGFEAVATTSAGVSWALGYADGQRAPWPEVVAATARMVRAAGVPVTADIEQGFGDSSEALARSIADIAQAGVVGFNLEDGTHDPRAPIRPTALAAERIRVARDAAEAAGVPMVINARTDLFLIGQGDARAQFDESVERARAYVRAGADCVYPIGLADPAVIERFAKAVGAPVNVMARPGMPSAAELQRLGVARASTASRMALVAMAGVRQTAQTLKASGAFDVLGGGMTHPEAQALFAQEPS